MENDQIRELYTRLTTDQAFAEELKKFVEAKDSASLADEVAVFVEFAKLQGYEITIDELKAFSETQCKALSDEELDSVNAAGGGYCLGLGFGWGEGYGIGWTKCTVIGKGVGITWSDTNDLENAEGNSLAKETVEKIATTSANSLRK
jgi:hypothetical protein